MKIWLTTETNQRIKSLVKMCKTEVGWWGLIQPVREGRNLVGVIVDEVIVPEQEVSAATVDADRSPEQIFSAMDQLTGAGRAEEIGRLSYWGHSHVNMGVTPSGTDLGFWKEAAAGSEEALKIFVATIHNKKGETFGRIYLSIPNVGTMQFDAQVDVVDARTPEYDAWAGAQIERFVKERTFRTVGYGPGRTWDAQAGRWREHSKGEKEEGEKERIERWRGEYGAAWNRWSEMWDVD